MRFLAVILICALIVDASETTIHIPEFLVKSGKGQYFYHLDMEDVPLHSHSFIYHYEFDGGEYDHRVVAIRLNNVASRLAPLERLKNLFAITFPAVSKIRSTLSSSYNYNSLEFEVGIYLPSRQTVMFSDPDKVLDAQLHSYCNRDRRQIGCFSFWESSNLSSEERARVRRSGRRPALFNKQNLVEGSYQTEFLVWSPSRGYSEWYPSNKNFAIKRPTHLGLLESTLSTRYIGDSCPICLEEFGANDMRHSVTETRCGHFFHKTCLKDWLEKSKYAVQTCPICRTAISSIHDDANVYTFTYIE